jgi:hypothetical protein
MAQSAAGLVTTSLFYSAANGLYPAFFSEIFDVKVRYTGVAIDLQLGLLIAGFSPARTPLHLLGGKAR